MEDEMFINKVIYMLRIIKDLFLVPKVEKTGIQNWQAILFIENEHQRETVIKGAGGLLGKTVKASMEDFKIAMIIIHQKEYMCIPSRKKVLSKHLPKHHKYAISVCQAKQIQDHGELTQNIWSREETWKDSSSFQF